MQGPREECERICWKDEFMLQAIVASWRSPDPNTQVGAVVVDSNNCIVGTGYNGFPRGVQINSLPWDRDKTDPLENKYAYVVHAEKNAIQNSKGLVTYRSDLYVTMHPCNNCAIDIIQAGIGNVTYLNNPYADHWTVKAAVKMFDRVNVEITQHKWQNPKVVSRYLNNLSKSVQK